ncbi:MAG: PEGA domain-containing protein [Bacteroidales bacterium]|nr:PEGA domain-containing protein [Bacteroidales bacterium]
MGVKSDNGQPLYWAEGDLIKENGSFRIGEHTEIGSEFYWGDPNGETNAAIGSNIPVHITQNKKYDVVSANTEFPNRMPSSHEFQRLLDNCEKNFLNIKIKEGKQLPIDPNDYNWIYGLWCKTKDFNGSIYSYAQVMAGGVEYGIQLYSDNTYTYTGDPLYLYGNNSKGSSGKFKINPKDRTINFVSGRLEGYYLDILLNNRSLKFGDSNLKKTSGTSLYRYEEDTYMLYAMLTSKINGNVLYFAIEENNGNIKDIADKKNPFAYWTGSADNNNGSKAYAYDYNIQINKISSIYRASYCKVRPVRDYAQRDIGGYDANFGIVQFKYLNKEFDGSEIYVDGKKIPEKLRKGLNIIVGVGNHNIEVKSPSKWYFDQKNNISVSYRECSNMNVDLEANYADVKITAGSSNDSIYIGNNYLGMGKWEGRLVPGTYNVECRRKYYHSYFFQINVDKKSNMEYTAPVLEQKTLAINVNSKPYGANIFYNQEYVGTTPLKLSNISAGSSGTLEIRKKKMSRYQCVLNLGEDKIRKVKEVGLPDYCIGESKLVRQSGLDIDIRLKRMHRRIFGYNDEFASKFYYADILTGKNLFFDSDFMIGFNLGAYIWRSINIECGLRFFTDFYFFDNFGFAIKAGYGFIIKGDFRITPQIGFDWCGISGGTRMEYAFNRNVSVGISPTFLYIFGGEVGCRVDAFLSFFISEASDLRIDKKEFIDSKNYCSGNMPANKRK